MSKTIAAAVAGLALFLAGCGGAPAAAPEPEDTRTAIEKAKEACIKGSTVGMEIMDSGISIEMRTAGEERPYLEGLDWSEVNCVLEETVASSATLAKMGKTRALDGTQTGSWDNYEASRTYHPDSGFNIILEDKS